MGKRQLSYEDYTIGWVCALSLEQTAAIYMLDERHESLPNPAHDYNTYSLGKVGKHNVVIAGLPKGKADNNNAATVAAQMFSTFHNIRMTLMVGVGGGIPEKTQLGDVVISSPTDTCSGVIQWDKGKEDSSGFTRKGCLDSLPTPGSTALATFESDPDTLQKMRDLLQGMRYIPGIDKRFLKSESLEDILFDSDYKHVGGAADCSDCDDKRIVRRVLASEYPTVHYGLIASGNKKIDDAKRRDQLYKENENLFCIEMEAAGLMGFHCTVIRGICDYADSHAGKQWQRYAAAVAAACAKTHLGVVPEYEIPRLQSVRDSIALSNIGARGEYEIRYQADSPPPSPQEFEGTTATAPRMIGGPSTGYYSNTLYTRHGESQYNANDLIQPFGEALANLMHGGNRRAQVTEETIDRPQTPPRSSKRKNHEHPRLQESPNRRQSKTYPTRPSKHGDLSDLPKMLVRRNTDLGPKPPLLSDDLSDPPIIGTTAPAPRIKEEPRIPGMAYSTLGESQSGDTIHFTHEPAKVYLTDNKEATDAHLDTFSHSPQAADPIPRNKSSKSSVSGVSTGDNVRTTDPNAQDPTDSWYATIHTRDSGFDKSANHGNWNTTQSSQELHGQDVSDAETVYSEESSTANTRRQTYIWELAEDLFESINSVYTQSDSQTNISKLLPDLLQAFALMIGRNAPTQMHRDIMAFVHKHRHEITNAFNAIALERDKTLQKIADNENPMTWEERMNRWLPSSEEDLVGENSEAFMVGEDQVLDELNGESADSEEEEVPDNWLHAYRKFILESESYEWLLGRLRRELHLYSTQPNTIQVIRDKILFSLPKPHKISKKVSSQTYTAIFEIDWDILGFFTTQGYLNPWNEVFEGVITLTGTLLDAQAATCAQYIRQTWPLTGEVMIQMVKGVLGGKEGNLQHCTLPDQTTLNSWINGSKFMVKVHGIAASIAEAGEQLAWLGAALRASPRRNRLILCTPTIKIYQNSPPLCQSELHLSLTNIIYKIGFTMEKDIHASTGVNGQCWHSLFRNPVIVQGYPIPRRIERSTGLEISLNIMAGLAQSQHISQFKGKLYIKGFSIMILPVRQDGEVLYWHLIYNKNGHRISYLDDNIRQEKQDIKETGLEHSRHILGWCSEIEFYAGSAQAHHPVVHSELPKPHAGCALAGEEVKAERIISGGPAFKIGIKDTPIHISREKQGYVRQFKWLSAQLILLWDEGEKRGWLIDSTSALLHLLRAFLAHAKENAAKSAFIFKNEDLQDVEMPYTAESATAVLINKRNWRLRLYEEDDDDDENNKYLLKSQIDYFFRLLERLIDLQADITGDEGIKLRSQPRKFLEGWDFEDIVTECHILPPRIATLEAAGKGWVDFIRGIHAVTLFGRGFGDIFRPIGTNMCKHWARLPKHKYYIASCLSDLGRLVKRVGNRNDGHVRLTDDVICHTPTSVFMSCQCGGDGLERNHCEPVQTLFPSALSAKLLSKSRRIPSKGTGAVIFGHHSSFPWIWGDDGHPREGQPLNVKDSGADSNLAYTESEDFASLPTKPSPTQLMRSKDYTRNHYTVGIICALPTELLAVRALFDYEHANIETIPGDNNQYALGAMGDHFIVATCLPAGEYGTNPAASAASSMKCSFSRIRFCLLVGIAGGVPSKKNDIRLGDVVVSLPTGTNSGVLQYDLGKEGEDSHFEFTGCLQRPPRVLTNAINFLRSDPDSGNNPLEPYLSKIIARSPTYGHPGRDLDTSIGTCKVCIAQQTSSESCSHNLQRIPRTTNAPQVHYGLVASGNRVMKNKTLRDQLAREHGMLCFEMEAAGIINAVDCLVIRGICDYCDAQKNDIWQNYAAATAAAYAKLLLSAVASVEKPKLIPDVKCIGAQPRHSALRSLLAYIHVPRYAYKRER